jgi:hypothetical protein
VLELHAYAQREKVSIGTAAARLVRSALKRSK